MVHEQGRWLGAGVDGRCMFWLYIFVSVDISPRFESLIGELPLILIRPDILLQKTPISIFVRSFYRSLIAHFNRQGGPYPTVY
jgi:hypothetical protein